MEEEQVTDVTDEQDQTSLYENAGDEQSEEFIVENDEGDEGQGRDEGEGASESGNEDSQEEEGATEPEPWQEAYGDDPKTAAAAMFKHSQELQDQLDRIVGERNAEARAEQGRMPEVSEEDLKAYYEDFREKLDEDPSRTMHEAMEKTALHFLPKMIETAISRQMAPVHEKFAEIKAAEDLAYAQSKVGPAFARDVYREARNLIAVKPWMRDDPQAEQLAVNLVVASEAWQKKLAEARVDSKRKEASTKKKATGPKGSPSGRTAPKADSFMDQVLNFETGSGL